MMQKINKRREIIKKAALNLFSKYGYKKVTIDEIVEKAGVAKGTFYLHFKDKDMLYVEICDSLCDKTKLAKQLRKLIEREKNSKLRLYKNLLGTIFYLNDRPIVREMYLGNKNFFSESVSKSEVDKYKKKILNMLFEDNSVKISKNISTDEFIEFYSMIVKTIFLHKKNNQIDLIYTDKIIKLFIDGVTSDNNWKNISPNEVIENFKKCYEN
ncbi:MAG: TetR family transcriptional regulator [Candidatus Magasanikbacteria bacterium]|nr:TetR family transcriptional regulator [Candidatus Magasanikbacteria bacterium]